MFDVRRRPGEILELVATEGLNPRRHRPHQAARSARALSAFALPRAQVMNLPDAQNHPAFAYRPETDEEPFASMLAVPVRRAGRTLAWWRCRTETRGSTEQEVDELETVAMLLAEVLACRAADSVGRRGRDVPRVFAGTPWSPGSPSARS